MALKLTWDGDQMFLGRTMMAEVKGYPDESHSLITVPHWRYLICPDGHISTRYENNADARQDCERHVRDMLVKAGA